MYITNIHLNIKRRLDLSYFLFYNNRYNLYLPILNIFIVL